MAGIGFELKKLYSEKGIVRGIRAFLYSFVVTVGPMMLCIALITFMQYLLEELGEAYLQRQVFLAIIQYSFIFSLLIAGGTAMYLSRYFADMMYSKRLDEILHALDFFLIFSLLVGTAMSVPFLYRANMGFLTALLAYCLFMILIVVWIYAIVITALKNYKRIFYIYSSGVLVGIIATLTMALMGVKNSDYYLLAVVLTFTIIATRLLFYVRDVFKVTDTFSTQSIEYIDIYGRLILVGFFMNAGIYIQNFVYWFSSDGIVIADVFRLAPFYDVPMFYAFLTVIPAMVFFVIFFETNFFDKYKEYYDQIIHGGGLQAMESSKKTMVSTLYQEYSGVMEIQLFFTIIFMLIGRLFLPRIGISQASIEIYSILTLGCYIYGAIYVCVIVLLYFDDITGATIVSASFFLSDLLFTFISLGFGERARGFGFFIATALTFFIGYARLSHYMKNLDYYTYCNQPLLQTKPNGFFTNFARRLNVLDNSTERNENGGRNATQ